MILYDSSYKIFGMGDKSLRILHYDSFDDFMARNSDLDDICENYKKEDNLSFVQDILKSPKSTKAITLRTKDNKKIEATAKVLQLSLASGESMYEVVLLLDEDLLPVANTTYDDELPALRLPVFRYLSMNEQSKISNTMLDDTWFERTSKFLNISHEEFASYLNVLVKGINKNSIALHNALMSHDTTHVAKIISILKEPAVNLHVTPLVKIYESVQNDNAIDLGAFILNIRNSLKSLNRLIRKYGRKV
ncbi:hypothetical protein CCAL13119_01715 [Campylobacter sp. RM13119]|uniref:hypothetical protein n=1 Tax=Campylobacter TaxID=194 RepID=UPI0014745A20|nr:MULTISPECIES: hypothetical protein [unclassified Campylobacter]MBE3605675.1 hypothetical protein [Campylobacter sp. RM13119]